MPDNEETNIQEVVESFTNRICLAIKDPDDFVKLNNLSKSSLDGKDIVDLVILYRTLSDFISYNPSYRPALIQIFGELYAVIQREVVDIMLTTCMANEEVSKG